jgi:hypothetical protein
MTNADCGKPTHGKSYCPKHLAVAAKNQRERTARANT